MLFLRLFDLRLFGFVCFLFLLVSGKGCGLLLWHSLEFSLTCFGLPDWKVNDTYRKNFDNLTSSRLACWVTFSADMLKYAFFLFSQKIDCGSSCQLLLMN